MTRRLSRHGLSCLLAWLLCASLYFWTASGNAVRYQDRQNVWHHYEYLVDGFLYGQTHLSLAPRRELLALQDPYDPKLNEPYRLGDASLYKGKYYLYFGPAPALLSMLPWKLLTGHHLPQWVACAAFATVGTGAISLLLTGVRKAQFPAASNLVLITAVLLTGCVSWFPVILTRPAVWELPIITATALFWWSIFFLWKFHTRARGGVWAFAGGLTLALAPAARPNAAPAIVFIALLFVLPKKPGTCVVSRLRLLLTLLIPLTVSAISLIAYNWNRFGSPLEFGQNYQLWGVDYRGESLFSPAYFVNNLLHYLLTIPNLSPYFPFFCTAWVGDFPPSLLNFEDIAGLFVLAPAVALGAAGLSQLRRANHQQDAQGLRRVVWAGALGGLLLGSFVLCSSGLCSRYLVELSAGWTLVTGIGCLSLFSGPSRHAFGGGVRFLSCLAIAWSFVGVSMASLEFRREARMTRPAVYDAIAGLMNYPSLWLADLTGQSFGPVTLHLRLPEKFVPGDTVVLVAGRPDAQNRIIVERLAANRVRFRAAANDVTFLATPVLAHNNTLVRIQVEAPWLYPPISHPYWKRIKDAAERRRLQTTVAFSTDAGRTSGRTDQFFDTIHFDPVARTQKNGSAWVEFMIRQSAQLQAGSPQIRPNQVR